MRLPLPLSLLTSALLFASVVPASPATAADGAGYVTTRVVVPMVFPVAGTTHLTDTFLACRGTGCSRKHMGQDLMGVKMTALVAAFDGVVTSVQRESRVGDGNYLTLSADRGRAAGWTAVYMHVNNDTPGTDDGRGTASWSFPAGIVPGARVLAGQLVGWRGDSGNAESAGSHLHFELHKGWGWGGTVYNAFPSLTAARRLSGALPSGPHPVGTLVSAVPGQVYLIGSQGVRRSVSPAVLLADGFLPSAVLKVTAAEVASYAGRTALPLRDGTFVRVSGGAVWLVSGGIRAIADRVALGRPSQRVFTVSAADLALVPVGEAPTTPFYPGACVRVPFVGVGQVDRTGALRPMANHGPLSWGLQASDVRVLDLDPPAVGAPLGLRDGTYANAGGRLFVASGGVARRVWDLRERVAYRYEGHPAILATSTELNDLRAGELTTP